MKTRLLNSIRVPKEVADRDFCRQSQVSGSELVFIVSEVFLNCYLEGRAPVQCEDRGVLSKVKAGFLQRD